MKNLLKTMFLGSALLVTAASCSKKNDLIAGQLVTPTTPVEVSNDTLRVTKEFNAQTVYSTAGKTDSVVLENTSQNNKQSTSFAKDANGKTTLQYTGKTDLVAPGAAGGQNSATKVTMASNADASYVQITTSPDNKVTKTTWKNVSTTPRLSLIAQGVTVASAPSIVLASLNDLKVSKLSIK